MNLLSLFYCRAFSNFLRALVGCCLHLSLSSLPKTSCCERRLNWRTDGFLQVSALRCFYNDYEKLELAIEDK